MHNGTGQASIEYISIEQSESLESSRSADKVNSAGGGFRVCNLHTEGEGRYQSHLASSLGRQSRSGIREYRGRRDRCGSLILGLTGSGLMSISKVAPCVRAQASWSPGAALGAKSGHLLALRSMKALCTRDQVKHIQGGVFVTTSNETRKRVPCQRAEATRKV